MNFKKTSYSLFLMCFVTIATKINGQNNTIIKPTINLLNLSQDSTLRFDQIQNNANAYFAEYHALNGPAIPRDEKKYKRWEYFWQNKLNFQPPNQNTSLSTHRKIVKKLQQNIINTCSSSIGNSWNPVGPNTMATSEQGIIQAVAVNPDDANVIFAGSYTSGLFKSTDGGLNWINKTDYLNLPSMGIKSIAIDKQNPNNMLIATGGGFDRNGSSFAYGILKSTDGGDNWAMVLTNNSQINGITVEVLRYANSNIVYAAGKNNIYKSIDGGASWGDVASNYTNNLPIYTDLNTSATFADIEINLFNPANPISAVNPVNPDIIYASTGNYNGVGEFYVSMDAGLTWAKPSLNLPIGEKISIDVTLSDPGVLYAVANSLISPYNLYLLKSIDHGQTWIQNPYSLPNSVAFGYFNGDLEISNLDNQVFYVSGIVTLKSINSGQTFAGITNYNAFTASIFTHADIRSLQLYEPNGSLPAADILFLGTDGGIIQSNDGGNVWQNINGNGLNITQFYGFDDMPMANEINGGTQDNGTLGMDNTGTWTNTTGGDGAWTITDDVTNPNIVYGASNQYILKSLDGGASWAVGLGNPTPDDSWNLSMKMYLDPFDHNNFYFLRTKLYLHNGTSWTSKVVDPNATNNLSAMAIAPCNNKIIYASYCNPSAWEDAAGTGISKRKFYKSVDGGMSFIDISSNPGLNLALLYWVTSDIIVDPNNPNHLYCSFNGYRVSGADPNKGEGRVLESTDGGATFLDISYNLPPFPVTTLEFQKGTNGVIFAGTDIGIYRYDPTTTTWGCFNNGMPAAPVTNIEINYCTNKIIASTFGRGIWESSLSGIYSAIHAPINVCGSLDNICSNTPVTLSVSGGINYTWSGGQTATSIVVSPNTNTTYNITADNICGTTTNTFITINVSNTAAPVLNIIASNQSICSGLPVTLSATGGVGSYTWQPVGMVGNPITVNQNSTTIYTVYANGAGGGCLGSQNININTIAKPTIIATADALGFCAHNSIPVNLTASPSGLSYVWHPGNLIGSSVAVSPANYTNYQVTGTDGNGCINTTNVVVRYSNIIPNFIIGDAFCSGPNVDGFITPTPSGGRSPYTYLWPTGIHTNPAQTTQTINNLQAGTYTVTIKDSINCQATFYPVVNTQALNIDVPYNTIISGSNDIWTVAPGKSKIIVDGLVVIQSGAKLTIPDGVLVEFNYHSQDNSPGKYGVAKIIVLAGGILNVQPTATLTGCSGGIWDGIELWGVGTTGDPYPNSIYSNINGYITNAQVGVDCRRVPFVNEHAISRDGGHLNSNGAHFVNNAISIRIPSSSDAFNYAINTSTFEINSNSKYDPSLVAANPPLHIYAGSNVNLNVQNNHFETTLLVAYTKIEKFGLGIQCYDCSLNVVSNYFKNLKRAIDVNHSSSFPVSITSNTMYANYDGIYMQGTSDVVTDISTNTITMHVLPIASALRSYGLFAIGCKNFLIANNSFSSPGSFVKASGMVFEDCGALNGAGAVFNNTINNNVNIGIQAQKNNLYLKIGCNTFKNPGTLTGSHSLAIVNVVGAPTSTLGQQGLNCALTYNPAGNEWNYSTPTCNTTEKNIFVDGTGSNISFKYVAHEFDLTGGTNTQPLCSTSGWTAGDMMPYRCLGSTKLTSSCGGNIFPKLPPPPPATSFSLYYEAIKKLIDENKQTFLTLNSQLKQALASQDGGNTKTLLNAIASNQINAGQLKNTLTTTGALSDAVLIAAINRQPALPPGILKDILFSQAPLSVAVLSALQGVNLPAGTVQNIYTAQTNTPVYVKTNNISSEINYWQREIYLLEAEYQRTKVKETSKICKEFCKDYNDGFNKELLANYYISKSEPDSLRQVISKLQSDSTIIVTEKQNLVNYYTTVAAVLDSSKTVYEADSMQISSLPIIELTQSKTAVHANTILKARNKHKVEYFIADIIESTNSNSRLMKVTDDDPTNSVANTNNFSIYPNPNTGNFKIQFGEIDDEENSIGITIVNVIGQTVYVKTITNTKELSYEIQCNNLPKGVYITTLIQNQKILGQSKLIIE